MSLIYSIFIAAGQITFDENLNFFIDLATITMAAEDRKPAEENPQTVSRVCNHPNPKHEENGKMPFKKNLMTRRNNRYVGRCA